MTSPRDKVGASWVSIQASKEAPVDGLIDHPGGDKLAAAQPGDERLGAPMTERRIGV
jgi:hypothetical protein